MQINPSFTAYTGSTNSTGMLPNSKKLPLGMSNRFNPKSQDPNTKKIDQFVKSKLITNDTKKLKRILSKTPTIVNIR